MSIANPRQSSAAPRADATCRIGARGVSRSFGPVRANVDVTLEVRPGTVHAVVGENGAGKSTLMRMLYGLDHPDDGTVIVDDEPVSLTGPRDAIARGIGLVQQELAIVQELDLLENLILGAEPRTGPRIDWTAATERATELARSVGIEIDWRTPAVHASIAIQQQVEILRLVYRGADVLILDEPTAVLAPAQADELLRLLGSLRDAGRTIVFISHKLDEVVSVADAVTVLRSGRTVASLTRGTFTRDDLAAHIVGDSVPTERVASHGEPGDVVLSVSALDATDDRGVQRLADVSFDVRSGEILGVAAVAGNGQEELAEVLVGIRASSSGDVVLSGRSLGGMRVRARRAAGVAYVSADRKHEGLALGLSLADNAIATPDLPSLARGGWLNRRRVAERVAAVLGRASVRYGAVSDPASSLSGGNQQRVVLGRETIGRPAVLVASQPTRGVDIRGIADIHDLLRRAREDGTAIVLFSEELDELRELSDRILVLHRGRVAGECGAGATRAEIGALMLGRHDDDPAATPTDPTEQDE
ncbi:nucleoside ABC transporter ATP-binding protein [Labedella gwakjiensis]|uniref:ABC transporter ATP-binding protein n=1 Tax=Labedella gwakjiensis TaxID=390269 RepID=A0A2P8GWR4_9MICO|nr:ABC transporter ATP-binding protein [Labedella gwakjiensis]PSL38411.1 nucleoside ABC transporter ATP-binding protein [Labedella gwakjiensis]RUQ87064.1 ABC transporter ATP-binding protein [Labedella gwakjiensis]